MLGYDKQDFLYSKAAIARDKTKERHDGNRSHFDKTLAPSFAESVHIVSHISAPPSSEDDDGEGATPTGNPHGSARKEHRGSNNRRRSPSPNSLSGGHNHRRRVSGGKSPNYSTNKSPTATAAMLGTEATHSRARDKINSKSEGDFNFGECISE